MREQARLQQKFEAWAAATRIIDLSNEVDQQLATAREFYNRALELEASDRASACVAAVHAKAIASWISRSTSTDADHAQDLLDLATSMGQRLECKTPAR